MPKLGPRLLCDQKTDKRIAECRISLSITLESNQQELQFCQIAPYQGDEKRQWLDDSDCQAFGLYSDTHVAARVLLSCGMIISAFGKQLASSNLLFISAARAQRIHHASNWLQPVKKSRPRDFFWDCGFFTFLLHEVSLRNISYPNRAPSRYPTSLVPSSKRGRGPGPSPKKVVILGPSTQKGSSPRSQPTL